VKEKEKNGISGPRRSNLKSLLEERGGGFILFVRMALLAC